jgi:phage internal scaffolding protein
MPSAFAHPNYARKPVLLMCDPAEGRTKQEFKAQCDINKILRKHDKTGLITHVNIATARFDDFTSSVGFHEAMTMVTAAQKSFDELPSDVRKKFGNDPAEFLAAIDAAHEGNSEQYELLVKLNLATPRPLKADGTKKTKDDPLEVKNPPKTE